MRISTESSKTSICRSLSTAPTFSFWSGATGEANRQSYGGPRGGTCERFESDSDYCPVPSRHWQQRRFDRLRRRLASQKKVAGVGKPPVELSVEIADRMPDASRVASRCAAPFSG